jgi:anti-anti-sigma factor
MDIAVTNTDGIAIVSPQGMIDVRGSIDFEKAIVKVLAGKTKRIVIDLQKVDMITSAGIRVLVMTGKRLAGDGILLLCGLSAQVKSVFDIAGLGNYFGIKPSVAEAVASLSVRDQAAANVGPSRMSRLAMRLLDDGSDTGAAGAAAAQDRKPSRLAATIESVLKDV